MLNKREHMALSLVHKIIFGSTLVMYEGGEHLGSNKRRWWEAALTAQGFKVLGSGAFGIAIASRLMPDKVIKVVPGDDPWRHYAALCMTPEAQTWNEAMRVFHLETVCGITVGVVEYLTEITDDAEKRRLIVRDGTYDCNPEPESTGWQFGRFLQRSMPSGAGFDLHSGNFRMRGEQLVVTDPWS